MSNGGSIFRTAPGVIIPQQSKSVDDKLKEASQMYEKLFLHQMMKAMRSTVQESGLIKQNQAEKIFRDELDNEIVKSWSETREGVGLADMIYNNLIEKYGAQLGLKEKVTKPQGPLLFNEKSSTTQVARVPSPRPEVLTYKFSLNSAPESAQQLESLSMPWNGILTEKTDLGTGHSVLGFDYENGLRGRLVFKGAPERLKMGQQVSAGEPLATLSPESRSFFWSVEQKLDSKNVSE